MFKIINFSADNGISGTTSKYVYKGKNYFRKKDVKGEAGDTINNVAIRRFAGIFNEEDIYVPAYRVREYNVTKTDESNLNNIEKSKGFYIFQCIIRWQKLSLFDRIINCWRVYLNKFKIVQKNLMMGWDRGL